MLINKVDNHLIIGDFICCASTIYNRELVCGTVINVQLYFLQSECATSNVITLLVNGKIKKFYSNGPSNLGPGARLDSFTRFEVLNDQT